MYLYINIYINIFISLFIHNNSFSSCIEIYIFSVCCFNLLPFRPQ